MLSKHKALLFVFLFCLSLGCLTGCKNKTSKSGFFFDTTITLTIYDGGNTQKKETLLNECFSLCSTYEHLFSRTLEGSDVYRINHSLGKPVQVSDETISLIQKALSYSRLSSGAFDCTIAPLSDLWNFTGNDPKVPSSQDISAARSLVDYQKVQIDGNGVTLLDDQMAIDLGGIAKGYIADRLKDYLVANGVTSGVINLGGNVLAIGCKPDASPFQIGIQKPFEGPSQPIASIPLADQSLVTSGVYERYFKEQDSLYHHLLNPKTGYPFDNGLYSVTILTSSSADADALSTTVFALGLEKGMELIESLDNAEALFVTDQYELYPSSGFPLKKD